MKNSKNISILRIKRILQKRGYIISKRHKFIPESFVSLYYTSLISIFLISFFYLTPLFFKVFKTTFTKNEVVLNNSNINFNKVLEGKEIENRGRRRALALPPGTVPERERVPFLLPAHVLQPNSGAVQVGSALHRQPGTVASGAGVSAASSGSHELIGKLSALSLRSLRSAASHGAHSLARLRQQVRFAVR